MTNTSKQYDIQQHGTTAHKPDLDWSQIQETITMLALAVAQVESSMNDGEESVSTLTSSFTKMAQYIGKIREVTARITPDKLDKYKVVMAATTQELEDNVQNAVVAFQFYDRITQRLEHVCHSIDKLGGLINDKSALFNPDKWQALQGQIKSSYTMEAERIMFEHILRGHSIQEALEIYRHNFNNEDLNNSNDDDEIELF